MFNESSGSNRENKTFKMIVVGALTVVALLGGGSIIYYFAIFAPSLEREKLEFERKKQAYDECVNKADRDYANAWSSSCSQQAEKNKRLLFLCNNAFSDPRNCQIMHGDIHFNPQCILPKPIAAEIENIRTVNMAQCTQNF